MAYNSEIEKKALHVLQQANAIVAPIPIELVARRLGLIVSSVDLGDDVSGVLVIEGDTGTIGYNSDHARVRQRFSIAHEIGHYCLHKKQMPIFVDKKYALAFRNSKSSSGEARREREANAFAAALLMPKLLITKEIKERFFDLADEDALRELASLFEVSTQAMAFRIANMGLMASVR